MQSPSPFPLPSGSAEPRRGLRILILSLVLLAALGSAAAFAFGALYLSFAAELPPADELYARSATFRSTLIYDREGRLLNETFDPDSGRRTVVSLDEISPDLVRATIATEDVNFYEHGGVDVVAILRAGWYALREREIVSGASTIPQQLVKRVFLSSERTVSRKVKEAVLASEITRRYSKDEILTLYLNEIFYGSLAYGCQSAAETFFGKEVSELSLAEAAYLAGLPQAPAYYDPYAYPERAKARQAVVLGLMVRAGYITRGEADEAIETEIVLVEPSFDLRAPHFTLLVREQVEAITGDPNALFTRGLRVTTSLDRDLQDLAERIVAERVDALADRNVGNGALVALEVQTGEILALVGSRDWTDAEISGQVNMATAPRQPGSALKPFVYLGNFERPGPAGWTPGTLIPDIRTEFPDGANPPYVPRNYDEREHGMVTVRAALANSYNIPAVAAMQNLGVPDFLGLLSRLEVPFEQRSEYGLAVALGGVEVPLLDLTGAYATLGRGGRSAAPLAIRRIVDGTGEVICDASEVDRPCLPLGERAEQVERRQAVSAVDAFLVTDMLSDDAARVPAFGAGSPLELGRPAAAKTGTTNDYRDNWTLGYSPDLAVGVWVGNADNSPMVGMTGVTGAGPIWKAFMTEAHEQLGLPARAFAAPAGVDRVEVCADTGTRPSEVCPRREVWYFSSQRPPLDSDRDLWQRVKIERSTGRLANEFTPEDDIEERVYKVYPLAEGAANPYRYREWAEANGIPQPPRDPSERQAPGPDVIILSPRDGATVSGIVTVTGRANIPDLERYELSFSAGRDPLRQGDRIRRDDRAVEEGTLGIWDTFGLRDGPYTLRLVVLNEAGERFEDTVYVDLRQRDASPTPTGTPTGTAGTPTVSPTPTPGASASTTATPSSTSAASPTATATRVPATATVPPTREATAKPTPVPATLAPRPTDPPLPTAPPPTATSAPPTEEPAPTEAPTAEPTEAGLRSAPNPGHALEPITEKP